jgi:hypothetical protein
VVEATFVFGVKQPFVGQGQQGGVGLGGVFGHAFIFPQRGVGNV